MKSIRLLLFTALCLTSFTSFTATSRVSKKVFPQYYYAGAYYETTTCQTIKVFCDINDITSIQAIKVVGDIFYTIASGCVIIDIAGPGTYNYCDGLYCNYGTTIYLYDGNLDRNI